MLVDSQKLVAPQQFCRNLVIFVCESLVSMMKIGDYFEAFSIVFNHACTSIQLLAEIHNTYCLPFPAILYLPAVFI